MTRFLDGPAAGVTLMLHRAPVLLRVVHSDARGWDALDQLADTPQPDERVVIYQLQGEPRTVHVQRDRRHGGCAWYRGGDYVLYRGEQPTDDVLWDTAAWREWACRVGPTIDPEAVAPEVQS